MSNCCLREVCNGKDVCTGYTIECPNNKSCRFYKPEGCKDWIRIGDVIYAPEDYFNGKKRGIEL